MAHMNLTIGKKEFVGGDPLNVTLNCHFKTKFTARIKPVTLYIPQVWLAQKVDS